MDILPRQGRIRECCYLSRSPSVTVPPVTLVPKVDPGLQDLQTRAWRILAERNAEKAEENTWIGVTISDLAIFNFVSLLYDVASEVSSTWLTPVYL